MAKEKLLSMAKTMKYLSLTLGVLFLGVAAVSLFLKTEDPTLKTTVMLFALVGMNALGFVVFGSGLASLLEHEANEKEKPEDDSGIDILA